jgi:hypothetical protein
MNINKALDKAFETKSFKELVNAPLSALQGLSDNDQKLLHEAFGIHTIKDLANLKFVKWAQAIVALADTEE